MRRVLWGAVIGLITAISLFGSANAASVALAVSNSALPTAGGTTQIRVHLAAKPGNSVTVRATLGGSAKLSITSGSALVFNTSASGTPGSYQDDQIITISSQAVSSTDTATLTLSGSGITAQTVSLLSASTASDPIFNFSLPSNLKNNGVTLDQLTGSIFSVVMVALGVIAFIGIVYSGVIMITSNGDASKFAIGRKNLTWAIIGLLVISLSYFIIQAVYVFVAGTIK